MARSFARYLPTGLVLALGLGFTLAATVWVERWERLTRQSEFQQQINNLTTALQRTTNRYNELLLSIGDFYRASNNEVDEAMFSRFVQRALGSYPGIQALEWAPYLTQLDRPAYEQWLQATTQGQQRQITERNRAGQLIMAAIRDSYVPVTYLEPWQSNEAALGYDLASDETRRLALEKARDTGELAASGRIQLVQETADDQYSFLVFLPVYRQPVETVSQRRRQLQGYILGVFRVADVVEETLTDLNYDVDFYIFDQTAISAEQFLGVYQASTQQVLATEAEVHRSSRQLRALCPTPKACTHEIQLGQRQWQIVFFPSGRYKLPWRTLATLLIGILITTSLLIFLSRWQAELRRTRELSNLKLRLFSMASHELRTPLSVITLSAQSLATQRTQLTLQQQIGTINRIQLAAKRMGQLVNDILTLTRAEAGKLEFVPEIVELGPFCRQLLEQIHLQPGQQIFLDGEALNSKAYVDPKLLQSILINLLSNGAKYSPENSQIRLVITKDGQTWSFQVTDPGIGIPAEAQSRIFEAFYRGDNVGTAQGTGLGLAVVKTCVDLHGGTLFVQSTPEQGTCITVRLPKVE